MEYLKTAIQTLGRRLLVTRGGGLQKAPKENSGVLNRWSLIGERWSHIEVRLYLRILFEFIFASGIIK